MLLLKDKKERSENAVKRLRAEVTARPLLSRSHAARGAVALHRLTSWLRVLCRRVSRQVTRLEGELEEHTAEQEMTAMQSLGIAADFEQGYLNKKETMEEMKAKQRKDRALKQLVRCGAQSCSRAVQCSAVQCGAVQCIAAHSSTVQWRVVCERGQRVARADIRRLLTAAVSTSSRKQRTWARRLVCRCYGSGCCTCD